MGDVMALVKVAQAIFQVVQTLDKTDPTQEILDIVHKIEFLQQDFLANFKNRLPEAEFYAKQELLVKIADTSQKMLWQMFVSMEQMRDTLKDSIFFPWQKKIKHNLREDLYSFLEKWLEYYFPNLTRVFLPNIYEPKGDIVGFKHNVRTWYEFQNLKYDENMWTVRDVEIFLGRVDPLLAYWYRTLELLETPSVAITPDIDGQLYNDKNSMEPYRKWEADGMYKDSYDTSRQGLREYLAEIYAANQKNIDAKQRFLTNPWEKLPSQ